MNKIAVFLLTVACATIANWSLAQPAVPVINTSISANAAAQALVGANVIVSNATFTGDPRQLAGFTNGMNKVGFENGILLTTCDATFAGRPNDGSVAGNNYGLNTGLSDPDLDILNGPGISREAAVLEFDFITSNINIVFDFVFASKEHNGWATSGFNDAFGFFISGPGINGPFSNGSENIALINGVPATVNNVNAGLNSNYIVTQGFPGYGVQNANDPSTWWFAWERWTIPVGASIAVECNTTYHAKIAICNTSDNQFHSGVFLRQGTLTSTFTSPGPLTIAPSPVCAGEEITLTVQGDPSYNYIWSTGQSGVGLQTITTTASLDQNSYSVTGEYLSGCSLSAASPAAILTVHNPDNSPPQCLGVNGTGNYTITMQVGEQTCFTIPTSDAVNERVEIQLAGPLPGGSFVGNNAFQESGTFCWVPGILDVGFHSLNIQLNDNNSCQLATEFCVISIKVVCDFCPVRVYYERRSPDGLPLPALTVAGESIIAGFSVDPSQQDGNVLTGQASVEFRAPLIDLQPGFIGGPGFLAVLDPNTCIEDCNDCCTEWQGFTEDTYPDENGVYGLNNWFEPDGDGWMDYWQVHDADNPFCAYGAQAYELTIWVGASGWGNQVWYVYEAPGGCCPFESRAPEHQIPHSSIYWDGTINTGFGNCYGCPVTTGTTYFYELNMFGCGGQKTYVGSIYVSGDVNGMVLQEPGMVMMDDSLQVRFIQDVASESLDENQDPVLYVFPNPAAEHVWVQYSTGIEQVSVLDAMGRRVLEILPGGLAATTLSLHELSPASYFLVVLDSQGLIHNHKLIKQ